MPTRIIEGLSIPRYRPSYKPLTLAITGYLGFSAFLFLIGLIYFTKDATTSPIPLIIVCAFFGLVAIYIFRKSRQPYDVPPLVPHDFQFMPSINGGTWRITINIQWSPHFDAKWPDEKNSPYAHMQNTNPTRDRFYTDVLAQLNRYLESNPENITSLTIENAIMPAIDLLQHSLRMPVVKYDCILVERPLVPQPAPKPDPMTGAIPDGYIGHAVSTPIGVILYAYKPFNQTNTNLPDIFFEEQTDKALVSILKNNPKTDLRTFQISLKIVIVRIEPKHGEGGKGAPVGDSR